jgi:hypothetical protein
MGSSQTRFSHATRCEAMLLSRSAARGSNTSSSTQLDFPSCTMSLTWCISRQTWEVHAYKRQAEAAHAPWHSLVKTQLSFATPKKVEDAGIPFDKLSI